MMTKEQVKQYAEELRRFIGKMEDEGSCEVKELTGILPAIEGVPGVKNITGALHYGTEITDFCRGRGLSYWIGAEMSGGRPYAYAHIF